MRAMKYSVLLLMGASACAMAVSAVPESVQSGFIPMTNSENPSYVNMRSIHEHPDNPNLLVYETVTNIHKGDAAAGKSFVQTQYLDCRNRIVISNPVFGKVYSRFFAKGELLSEIPFETVRFEMKETSPISIVSTALCDVSGRDFGGNPNALEDLKKELDTMQQNNEKQK